MCPRSRTPHGWHGKPLKADVAEAAVRALGGVSDRRVETPPRPPRPAAVAPRERRPVTLPKYEMGMKVATRAAFGDALAALGARPEVVAIDGEVGNSTFTEKFGDAYPERFFQMYISEQQMIGAAVGMSVRGYVPFAATFAAFLTRAYDFIRMAAVSRRTSACAARTRAWRSARTGRRRWASRTSPPCARCTGPRCSTRATPTRRRRSPRPWPTSPA